MAMRAGCMFLAVSAIVALGLMESGCSRNNIEAVNLSNEGDKAKSTNLDEAISKYEQATQLDPTNYRILFKLANAYKKKESWDKVASTCAKAEKLAPDHADFFYLHGYALKEQGVKDPSHYGEAKAPLQQAIKLDPNLSDAYFDLGDADLWTDDEQGALQNYTQAIQAKPDNLDFYGPLADLYIRLGFYQQADQVLKEALNYVKPGDKGAFAIYSFMGEVEEINKNISGAVADFEKARAACGECNEKGQQIAYFNLGAAYSKANPPRKNEAIAQLTKFNKIVCKGGAAQRYQDECTQASEIVKRMGGTL